MNPLVVVDSPKRWPLKIPGTRVVSSREYLSDPDLALGEGVKVFNLCRSYRYQSAGYYVSLLGEARGHRPLPSIAAIQDLKLSPVVRLASQDLDELIQASLARIKADRFELSVYFGRNLAHQHDRLALAIFNAFPAPLMRAKFQREDDQWALTGIRAVGLGDVPESHHDFVVEQAERYLRRAPRVRTAKPMRFDLAILHDPHDPMPPSDPEALRNFIKAGESLGIRCELVEKDAYGRLAEFDGLFIRETTAVNHHTYRFARRAAAEGLVVVDDPVSIVRCTNKVYLAETLTRHNVPIPRSVTFSRDSADAVPGQIGLPCVIKKPDSSFSVGVRKASTIEEFDAITSVLFDETDLLVAQEFVPTDYDWRIGVLDGNPLFACRYFMAKGHWQIVKQEGGKVQTGAWETVPLAEAPDKIVKAAVKAASLIGDGLYGVDVKQIGKEPRVIEVNDNPNIDAGVEDQILGDRLYTEIMRYFLTRMEARRSS